MTVARFRTIIFIVVAIVSLAGLADATYLSVQALTGETLGCGGSPDCFRVLGSSYAKVAGMPVAMFGALAYFSVFTFATFAAFGYSRARIFLILTIGAMFLATLWFLYVQAFLLHAYCRYCLFSAATTFLLAGLAIALPPKREQIAS
ncbi:MAG: vitamin K epoxide reductase family protein [Candidatus Udaeobacter sp.]